MQQSEYVCIANNRERHQCDDTFVLKSDSLLSRWNFKGNVFEVSIHHSAHKQWTTAVKKT